MWENIMMKFVFYCAFFIVLLLGVLTSCGWSLPSKEPAPAGPDESVELPEALVIPSEVQEPDLPDAPAPSGPDTPEPEAPAEEPETLPADEELVDMLTYIPSLFVDLKYATADNFIGTVIYDFTAPSLRYGTVRKLAEVQEELLGMGYSLKIWDAFRPVSAQFKLWEILPDANFVANPNTGHSNHSRGNAVDLTMVLADGTEIPMPTDFDDFSPMADRDYSDVPEDAAENARLLETIMTAHGFKGYQKEWWHYADETAYPVIED